MNSFRLLMAALLVSVATSVVSVDSSIAQNEQAVGAFIGALGGIMQYAIEQQRLKDLQNSPEFQDQQIQPGGLTRRQVMIVQQLLTQRGYDVGGVDGIIGPKTSAVVAQLQAKAGVPITGYPTSELLEALLQQ